ncbi:uncharacterized protein FA14DRAFT_49360 [Meira miltonrushii]|uniref:Uncharacterized protein n=1 Tax=Meira miltonrushii TaxID=1280837 RepID=A0A316VF61_9BASI|nr:uncharacterized protein FA14DRAFT_49360 [Meira miltonrushii]PWN35954.1 hypothetical protein FA14DRAFT_49360 [Meira miltonrushii]
MKTTWLSRRGCTSGPTGQQICTSITTQDQWTATGIGSGLGVFVALIAFVLLLVFLERRKKRRASLQPGDEEDGSVIDPHRIDIDTTPQSYYAGEVEMRNGILVDNDANKKDNFDLTSAHLYPPPPATLAQDSSSSSAKATPSIREQTLIRNDSGSSLIPSPPLQTGTDSLDIPPPAYVEKSSNKS